MALYRSKLKQMDHGYAWIILAACTFMRTLIDGFMFSIGILLVKWEAHFNASSSEISWIGSSFMFILFISSPIALALSQRLSYRLVTVSAGIITCIALFALSLVQELWQMYPIMPALGIGTGLAFHVSYVYFVSYFDKRYAFATTLNGSSVGLGTFVLPPLIELLIQYYGWRGALQILAAVMANICVCGSLMRPPKSHRLQIKKCDSIAKNDQRYSRVSHKRRHSATRVATAFNLSLFRNVRFLLQSSLNGILFWGFYVASVYFVPYSISIGVNSLNSTFLVSAGGICNLIARVSPIGWIVDKKIISATTLGGIAYVICGIVIMVMPFTNTFMQLLFVAIMIGLTNGIGGSLIMVVISYTSGSKEKVPGALAWFTVHCGIGSLLGIVLTGYLLDAFGSYTPPLIFGGICIAVIGVNMLTDPLMIKFLAHLEKKRNSSYVKSTSV